MALTTATAFSQFGDKIQLTDTQKNTVRDRRQTVHGYLSDSFGSDSNMPLLRAKLIGSAGRSTMIRPPDDVDVLAVFAAAKVWPTYQWDSKKFLYRVRDALAEYQVKIVGARGQAVRLFYNSPPNVDIAPVFEYDSGGYALPRGDGGWLTTDPDYHETFLTQRNSELGGNLKPLIRMLKCWNRAHSGRLRSFHLEVVVQATFKSLGSNFRDAACKFFEWAGSHLSVQDPAGHSGDLSSYLTWSARDAVVQSFATAHGRAKKALEAEDDDDHKEAIRLWRLVFGDEFPAYG